MNFDRCLSYMPSPPLGVYRIYLYLYGFVLQPESISIRRGCGALISWVQLTVHGQGLPHPHFLLFHYIPISSVVSIINTMYTLHVLSVST